jgi:CheY-like chemotaxis protein
MNNPNAKILVVDDVAENRDLLLRRLTRLGFAHIDQAANGAHRNGSTDGFTEAHNPGNALYGEGRVVAFLADLAPSEGELLEHVAGLVRAFEAGRPAFDDTAALLSLEPGACDAV